MTNIICRASTCLFWEQGVCGTEEIEYEPDVGCLTFQDMGDLDLAEEEEEEGLAWSDSDDEGFEEDDWEEEEEDWTDDWDEEDL